MRRNARRGVRERYRDMEIEKWWERERERKAETSTVFWLRQDDMTEGRG